MSDLHFFLDFEILQNFLEIWFLLRMIIQSLHFPIVPDKTPVILEAFTITGQADFYNVYF